MKIWTGCEGVEEVTISEIYFYLGYFHVKYSINYIVIFYFQIPYNFHFLRKFSGVSELLAETSKYGDV